MVASGAALWGFSPLWAPAPAAAEGLGVAAPENGTAEAAGAMPIAEAVDGGRTGGWSPYWLVLLVIPAALAGGGAGYLIRTR